MKIKTKTQKVASESPTKPKFSQRKIFTSRAGETVLQTMARKFKFRTRHYEIGEFVTSIDGVAAGRGKFWKLKISGRASRSGAAKAKPGAGKRVEWDVEELDSLRRGRA